jgi:MarR-like DNA-binding transcriptional regulator SgrR of sgrS sRNA
VLRRFAISCLFVAAALACSGRTRPHFGGTLRVEIESDPWQHSGHARRLVLDGLTRFDEAGAIRPALAVRWASDNDSHRWQFWLRPGVHFHDGSALTAISVVASLTTTCGTACAWSAVRAIGPSIIFTADSPMPNLPALLASDNYLIALVGANFASASTGLVGTGPFQAAGFANNVLTLTANESCWQGRPFVDAIQLRVHRSIHDQWLDLTVGHADVVEVPAEQLRQAQQQRLTVLASPPATLLALEVSDFGTLANPMLRSAIAFAVDRNALSNVIFQKQGEVTASLLPRRLSGYSFLFPVERDPSRANQLRGGLTPRQLTLSAEGGSAMQLAAQRVALNLREAGFNVQVTNGPHADMTLRMLSLAGSDAGPALEQMLRSAGQTVPVLDKAPAALFKVEHELLARNTLIPLLYLPRAYAVCGRVRDLRLDSDGLLDLADVSLEDGP